MSPILPVAAGRQSRASPVGLDGLALPSAIANPVAAEESAGRFAGRYPSGDARRRLVSSLR